MLSNPAPRTKALVENIQLFKEYHLKYPSHGYRWLNAKIRLDTGVEMSDPYAHKGRSNDMLHVLASSKNILMIWCHIKRFR